MIEGIIVTSSSEIVVYIYIFVDVVEAMAG